VPDIEFIIELSQIMQIVRVRLVSVQSGSALPDVDVEA
jgi:hypothetical protein